MKFTEKVGGVFKSGFAMSKAMARKAGKKATELGSMGALKIEGAQLKSEERELMEKLGEKVYSALMDKNHAPLTRETPGVGELVVEITKLRKRLASKDKEYLAIGATEEIR
ncbi:MAG TPA: hypothetical protein VMV44_00095 [Rectinemataceae bacterium]|nr:hypothetical protein [Rectinemataceae bacterium]